MAAAYQFTSIRCCGHSTLVIFNLISYKFHIWIASIKLWFKFKYFFSRRSIIKMADKMTATYQFTSIRCCGHSNLAIFFIGFLTNFTYGLLPSNPGSSSNMGFFRRIIIKMADKMTTAYPFTFIRCCGHSNIVIFNWISYKFHIWIASIKLWSKLEYVFFRRTISKMADKMAATYQFTSIRSCGQSNLVIFNWISYKFVYGLLPSNSGSSLNMSLVGQHITKMADKMADAYQFASVRWCGHSYLVIFIMISSNFRLWIASITRAVLSLNMSFVRPTIAKMAEKWPPPTSSHSWTPYLSHLLPDCFQITYMDYCYRTLTHV